jgi:hypothetical protein
MILHDITKFYAEWFNIYPNITSKFAKLLYWKASSDKITTQTKLASVIFYCAQLNLPKCNCSWHISVKGNMSFKVHIYPPYWFFLFSQKWSSPQLLVLSRPISVQHCVVPRWLFELLHPTQEFERPPFWNEYTVSKGMTSRPASMTCVAFILNVIKDYWLVQK